MLYDIDKKIALVVKEEVNGRVKFLATLSGFLVVALLLIITLSSGESEAFGEKLSFEQRLIRGIAPIDYIIKRIEKRRWEKQQEVIRLEQIGLKLKDGDKKLAAQRKFGRVSFFLGGAAPATLIIPEDWGSKYLTIEERNKFEIQFVRKGFESASMLRVWQYNVLEWQDFQMEKDSRKVLGKSGDQVLVYEKVSPPKNLTVEEKKNFQILENDLELVISSYKPINQNKK